MRLNGETVNEINLNLISLTENNKIRQIGLKASKLNTGNNLNSMIRFRFRNIPNLRSYGQLLTVAKIPVFETKKNAKTTVE